MRESARFLIESVIWSGCFEIIAVSKSIIWGFNPSKSLEMFLAISLAVFINNAFAFYSGSGDVIISERPYWIDAAAMAGSLDLNCSIKLPPNTLSPADIIFSKAFCRSEPIYYLIKAPKPFI